jgi:hypothetical protein
MNVIEVLEPLLRQGHSLYDILKQRAEDRNYRIMGCQSRRCTKRLPGARATF